MERFKREASLEAIKSECNRKHGCLIIKGNHVYAFGHNTGERSKVLGVYDFSIHAEISAVNMFNNLYLHKKKCKRCNLKKFIVFCVRIAGSDINKNTSSGPCKICLERLKKLGFKRIAFTNINNEIEIHKIEDYSTTHYTDVQKEVISEAGFYFPNKI